MILLAKKKSKQTGNVKNGDRKEAAQRLSYMKEQGGKTFFPRLADEIREKKLAQQKQK